MFQHQQHRQLNFWPEMSCIKLSQWTSDQTGGFGPDFFMGKSMGFRLRFSRKNQSSDITWIPTGDTMIWPNTLIFSHQGPAGDFDNPFDTRHSGPAFWLDGLIHLEQWQNQLPVANVYPKMVFLWWFSQPIRKARPIGLKSAQQIGNRDTAWKICRKIHKFPNCQKHQCIIYF